ncbi:hypothetical protein ACLOJK_021577 [Asimina triloba]
MTRVRVEVAGQAATMASPLFRSLVSRPSPSVVNFHLNVVVVLSNIFFLSSLAVVPSLSLSAVIPFLSLQPSFLSSIPPSSECRHPPSPLHPLTAPLCLVANLVVGLLPSLARRLLYLVNNHLPALPCCLRLGPVSPSCILLGATSPSFSTSRLVFPSCRLPSVGADIPFIYTTIGKG